jgi:hypothetical protein
MDGRQETRSARIGVAAALLFLMAGTAAGWAEQAASPRAAEQRDMRPVGHDDLQARSGYQPVIHKQGARWIAYIGHHGGHRHIYIVDRADTGLDILELTGAARAVANLP